VASEASRPWVQGADLGHQKSFIAPAFEAQAEPGLGFAAIIFPGIVVESDAPVEGAVNDIDRRFLVLSAAEMVAAQTERGDLNACFTERSKRDRHLASFSAQNQRARRTSTSLMTFPLAASGIYAATMFLAGGAMNSGPIGSAIVCRRI
jgi:hypothetical protein